MTPPIIHLPETTISADDFLKLFSAIFSADSEEDAKAAMARFKTKMDEMARNQKAAKGEEHHNN